MPKLSYKGWQQNNVLQIEEQFVQPVVIHPTPFKTMGIFKLRLISMELYSGAMHLLITFSNSTTNISVRCTFDHISESFYKYFGAMHI